MTNPTAHVDAVVLDYRLPDSNDLTLLVKLRKPLPGSSVILMTAYGAAEIAKRALDLGACLVMHKPFDMHDLEPLLLKACGLESSLRLNDISV